MWHGPFHEFPRQMGYPIRSGIIYSMKEFLEKVNNHNGKTTVFTSLYSFTKLHSTGKPDFDSAKIQHLFFDLDNDNCLENARKLHEYLTGKHYQHMVFFSGGGFHIYVAVEYPNILANKKAAILNAVTKIADDIGLKIGINSDSDIDGHIVGNIAQLVRVPNTFNLDRKRFCIPLTNEIFEKDLNEIKELAIKQHFKTTCYEVDYFDLEPYDREPSPKYNIPQVDFTNAIGIENIDVEKFPPCIKKLLTEKLNKHRHRYIIISYCKEMGLPLSDTVMLLRKYLDTKTFNHCVNEERQPVWVYRRNDLNFPSCIKLREEGLCDKDCRRT